MINLDTTLESILERYPRLSVWLMRRGLLCVACPFMKFHTLDDAAVYHNMAPQALLESIRDEVGRLSPPPSDEP
jgi:hybrid cluster-associated redox disulfide protein